MHYQMHAKLTVSKLTVYACNEAIEECMKRTDVFSNFLNQEGMERSLELGRGVFPGRKQLSKWL